MTNKRFCDSLSSRMTFRRDIQADPLERTNLADRDETRIIEFEMRTRRLNWMINSTETDQIQPRWNIPDQK